MKNRIPTIDQIERFLNKHEIAFTSRLANTGSRYFELLLERGNICSLIPGEFESEIFTLRVSDHEGYDSRFTTTPTWNVCPEDMSWAGAKAAMLETFEKWPGGY